MKLFQYEHTLIFILLFFLGSIYLKLAKKYQIIDKPNERSSHTNFTIRGGGIVFVFALGLFFLGNNFQYPYFIAGTIALAIISFLDDIYTLSSKIRFPFQLLAVALLLHEVALPFSPIAPYLSFLLLGIGVVNMFNFMDGINGITGMYSFASLVGFYAINAQENIVNNEIIFYTFIAIGVFGFYNFRKKALFFAGDIGSISIGMLIYFVGVYLAVRLQAPLMFLAIFVYGADAGCTLLYRKFFTNESIFAPHRHHIYQKLVHVKKIPHLTVSVIYAGIQLVLNIVLFFTYQLPMTTQLLVLVGFIIVFITGYIVLFKKLEREL
ncbi:UDP-GlcNAc--UDP-phosphate GlcNAc-1-phosphate transferase [Polaribacter gangjinensis]|uniref:UDP-GlcNAc--UDP-phosphate GlcNAc-1-phosphate transferase n=1 Tax=Polaribacter gangjinensis TaxID=574710 RepID=A0A2S7W848_9FLAO|nr:UDP-GlcNAc--UDP-phosphate GlcNAc-1-phosphate transferase [Polaribacter gangjinensis]PQJ73805.1 hypothetical protein BTO13_00275 [Polaribacter gangjinensis]